VACEVVFREICHCAARSVNQLDLEFLSQGFHDNPEVGLERLQGVLDGIEPGRYDAVLMGYGLCNNMLAGLRAPEHTRVVVPRAHDCITFLYGSKDRYRDEFDACPGTYVYTAGWMEHRQRGGERPERRQNANLGDDQSYEAMVAQYGEDNARYLQEFYGSWTSHYSRGVYVNFDFTDDLPYREQARQICAERGWEFVQVDGDLSLIQAWLNGTWAEDQFLVAEPGQRVIPSHDDAVLQIAPIGA